MKYRIKTHELCWYDCCYLVEADSKMEARDLIESGEGNIEYSDYDTTTQVDIESVEEI
jgi:hypothetical protein